MVKVTDYEKTVKPGKRDEEYTIQQTISVKVEDDVELSNTAEHLVEAQTAVCGQKVNPVEKSKCELQQEELMLGPHR